MAFHSFHFPQPKEHLKNSTLSPIYLSRMLNSISCSISVCRDDPLSIVSLIELSRRFSNGLWNCIQFWACCGSSLAIMNMLCACISLPPILTPFSLLYLMTVAIPLLSVTLVKEVDSQIMNRATGKKQTQFDSKVFFYVLCCYGCKFLPTILIMVCPHTHYPSDDFLFTNFCYFDSDVILLYIYGPSDHCDWCEG